MAWCEIFRILPIWGDQVVQGHMENGVTIMKILLTCGYLGKKAAN